MSHAAAASRVLQITASLAEINSRINSIAADASTYPPTLVAVSKYKPASDILAAYAAGQRGFAENYVHELLDKAPVLPSDIQWHFIGHLQSNKAKTLAAIPNLHTLHTLTSSKLATTLNNARAAASSPPLNVLLQVNTSGEDSKFGLPPIIATHPFPKLTSSEGLLALAQHVITSCPNLRLAGLMTIGSLQNSLASGNQNHDFQTLIRTREAVEDYLRQTFPPSGDSNERSKWGDQSGSLVLSMGMSSDLEAAVRAGSNIVRVGTAIFGERRKENDNSIGTS